MSKNDSWENFMIYDVVIVGAGPAGTTFARQLASGDKRILIIDGQNVNNKKPCGGLLSPDAQKALARFDLVLPKSVLVDPQIFAVKTIDLCSKLQRYYQRCYLNMDRFAFDKWLVSLIPSSVDIIEGKCIGIIKTDDIFSLDIIINGKKEVVQAGQVVGANSIVRKTFFKNKIMHYVAIQQWFENVDNVNPFYSCVFDKETSESCSWIMHKDGNVIFGGCFKQNNCQDAFETQKIRLEKFLGHRLGDKIKTEGCITYRPRKLSDFQTGKNGVYLIGESAGFISPSSFEGISSAIISGELLAESFLKYEAQKKIAKHYKRKTIKLRMKFIVKIIKRWFMYTPFVRKIIMKTGVGSIKIHQNNNKWRN